MQPAPLVVPSFRWSAVLAGSVVAVGVWLVLHLVGMGIGLVAINPNDPSTIRSIGLGTGIWSLAAPLVALFIGGIVAGRVAGPVTRGTGAIHGAVLWSLATIATALAVIWVAGTFAGGVDKAAARVAGVEVEQTPEHERQRLAQDLAERTQLSHDDAQRVAGTITEGLDAVGGAQKALHNADTAGNVLLAVSGGLALGLVIAMLGAALGVSRRQRRAATVPGPREVVIEP